MEKIFKEFENCNIKDSFVVFDLETTGLNPYKSEILEIGAIKFENGKYVSKFHEYVKPNSFIPYYITNINHISNEMVANSNRIDIVLKEFLEYIDGYKLVGHNIVNFDLKFIKHNCIQTGLPYNINEVDDTLFLARDKFRNLPNCKLETIKNFFNLKNPSHDAINDCIVTAYTYFKCKS